MLIKSDLLVLVSFIYINIVLFFYQYIKIKMNQEYVEIDGSLFQGGGQMIRSSLALATILNKGFRMHSIRKNRPKPGINNQLQSVFSAFTDKVPQIGQQQIYIYPNFKQPKWIKAHSAASCTLMLQCFVPVFAALGYIRDVKIQGGTDVSKSPCQESIQLGLIPLMKMMGVELTISDIKKGYYPKGFGYIVFNVKALQQIKPIQFTKFTPPKKVVITYYIKTDKLPNQSKDFVKEVKNILNQYFPQQKVQINIKVHRVSYTKDDYGIGCMLLGDRLVWDIGTVGQKIQQGQILQRLRHYAQLKLCLDQHHQDQLLLLAALAAGKSRIFIGNQLSLHTQSLLYVIKQFISEFKYNHTQDGILQIQGIGYKCLNKNVLGKKEQKQQQQN